MRKMFLFLISVLPLLGWTICLDPGHGGSDPDATGTYYTEKEANIDVAFWTKHYLELVSGIDDIGMSGYVGINDDGAVGGDVVIADAVLWVYDGPLRMSEDRIEQYQLSISVYPNPFNSFVSIVLGGVGASRSQSGSLRQIAQIEIFDMNGRLVGDLPLPSTSLEGSVEGPTPLIWRPAESLHTGMYLAPVSARVSLRNGYYI